MVTSEPFTSHDTFNGTGLDPDQPLDVLDLPQIYQKPSAQVLINALNAIALTPLSWSTNVPPNPSFQQRPLRGNPSKWLTTIISSPMCWIKDESLREDILNLASTRLSERCGRSAMPAMTRSFFVPSLDFDIEVKLHEPTMTGEGDIIGLKTWGAAYLLAGNLCTYEFMQKTGVRVLELGAGTGLVGIAASKLFPEIVEVHMTDLPEIVPNLSKNIALNECGENITSHVLDWKIHKTTPADRERYPVILASDPLYSKEHPKLLRDVVSGWMEKSSSARFVVEFPERELYIAEREDFWRLMDEGEFELVEERRDTGRDDWGSVEEGEEVKCWRGVYRWKNI